MACCDDLKLKRENESCEKIEHNNAGLDKITPMVVYQENGRQEE